jgi:hypothetical protein
LKKFWKFTLTAAAAAADFWFSSTADCCVTRVSTKKNLNAVNAQLLRIFSSLMACRIFKQPGDNIW